MSFESEINAWSNGLRTDVLSGIKEISQEIFIDLCENSPAPEDILGGGAPFSLGSFVLSHRISGGSADTSITQVDGKTPTAVLEAFNNELPKLDTIMPFNDIVISNSIYYNENIENIGWTNTGPYHTFHKTEEPMETKAQLVMGRI